MLASLVSTTMLGFKFRTLSFFLYFTPLPGVILGVFVGGDQAHHPLRQGVPAAVPRARTARE